MASPRHWSRRSWFRRLRRWRSEHRTGVQRAMCAVALLAGVWLLWPEPAYQAIDQHRVRSAEQKPAADGSASDGLVGAAQASVAVSAKRELTGAAVVVQYRLRERLRQVAEAMPDIDIPQQPPVDGTGTVNASPESAQPQEAASAALERDEAAPADTAPVTVAIGRAATEVEHVATAVERVPPEVVPGPAVVMPAAVPSEPDPSASQPDRRTVALLDAPAAIMTPEPGRRGTPTWLRNAVSSVIDARPAVAIVIDDLGLNRRGTAALNHLRAPLTLAFLPYATDLDEQTRAAHAAGHELLVHVPMEPRTQDWPGPNALTSQLGPAELVSRLRSHLRSFGGFVGVNNHMGSLLTTDPERMAIVMAELRQRGLLFLDSRTSPDSVAAREAERSHVPFAQRDVFIDNELEPNSVLRGLTRAESIARHQGYAVAMGHPHDVTIEALKRWLPTLDARGIALVPISAIVARQSCASGLILVGNACDRYAVAETAAP
jgi:polysaccharide deacetylase 2 family uncharacterized protein YibQ